MGIVRLLKVLRTNWDLLRMQACRHAGTHILGWDVKPNFISPLTYTRNVVFVVRIPEDGVHSCYRISYSKA